MHSRYRTPCRRRRAFSLIELMVVVAIITIVATFAVPAVSNLGGSGKFNQSIATVSGLLDQARQYAIAQNTYVWVGFANEAGGAEGDRVWLGVLASKDGTRTMTADNVPLISRLQVLQNTQLPAASPALPGGAGPAQTGADLGGGGLVTVSKPGGGTLTFERFLRFSPSGEAQVPSGGSADPADSFPPVNFAEFGLLPVKGSTPLQANAAIIQVNGLTGNARVYRPDARVN